METTYIIKIACKRVIKRAFKLFDDETRCSSLQRIVEKLRLTSKHLNNSICDELSLEIMHRWMKGRDRCASVAVRIEQILEKCDYNDLFRFMDVVTKIFSKRESVRLLSSFLIKITQHHKHILKDYMDFFTSRELHLTMQDYYSELRSFPFPGFTPQQVEKSLQIANENGWIEESLLLLDHLTTNYYAALAEFDPLEKVRLALKSGQKLNFSANLANRINNLSRHRDSCGNSYILYCKQWLLLYLDAKQITTTDLTKVLHSVDSGTVEHIFARSSYSKKKFFVISFAGSQLIKYHYGRGYYGNRMVLSKHIPKSTTIFTALPVAPENCQTTFYYYFHRAVVDNDLETAKQLHQKYEIKQRRMNEFFNEYFNHANLIQQQMVDYLVNNFDGIECCLHGIDPRKVTDNGWAIICSLIERGAKIYQMPFWERFFNEKMPRSEQEFKRILDVTERMYYPDVLCFLMQKFYKPSLASFKMQSQTKQQLLLAWRYDTTCHLSKLPKELLKLIVELIDELPVFIQYAIMIVNRVVRIDVAPCPSEALERTGEIARFIRDYKARITRPWTTLSNYSSERAVKRDVKHLQENLETHKWSSSSFPATKVYRYFCKHETNEQVLKNILDAPHPRYAIKMHPFLEYATVAKNISFLHEFYKIPANIDILPNKAVYASIAPKRKNKMNFEEALALANQVRSNYIHNATMISTSKAY